MSEVRKANRGIMVLVIFALSLAACAGPAAEPTPNPEMIFTEAAITVQAGLTQTAAALPTMTPTYTPEPTNTPEPTLAESPTPNAPPTNTIAPAATTRPASPDRAEWVAQTPADGTVLFPDQPFTLVWTVKNTGTTTWNTRYQVRYFLADQSLRFGATDIRFPKDVKPNETVDLTLTMRAPTRAGDYTTVWVMTNADGANFYTMYLRIKVSGVTATPSPTVTQPPAQTPTPTTTLTAPPTATPGP